MICFCIVLIPKKEFFLSVTLCFKHLVLFRFLTAGKNIWTVGVPLSVYWRGAVSVLLLPGGSKCEQRIMYLSEEEADIQSTSSLPFNSTCVYYTWQK